MSEKNVYVSISSFEPAHEIMALFILRKLFLQTCMRSPQVGLDVWFFVRPFVYFHTSCVRTAKALARLHGCAGSPEPSLVAYVISTIISWAGSFILQDLLHMDCVKRIWYLSPMLEQRRFRRACASAQSRQNLCCSLIQALNQEEPSDRKSDPWPLWMAGHAQLKFVMTECSKTQIHLTRPIW